MLLVFGLARHSGGERAKQQNQNQQQLLLFAAGTPGSELQVE